MDLITPRKDISLEAETAHSDPRFYGLGMMAGHASKGLYYSRNHVDTSPSRRNVQTTAHKHVYRAPCAYNCRGYPCRIYKDRSFFCYPIFINRLDNVRLQPRKKSPAEHCAEATVFIIALLETTRYSTMQVLSNQRCNSCRCESLITGRRSVPGLFQTLVLRDEQIGPFLRVVTM